MKRRASVQTGENCHEITQNCCARSRGHRGLLSEAIYQDDQLVAVRLPLERKLQFTYYPDLEKLLPQAVQMRIEGSYEDGEAFVARFAVTPDGFYTASRHEAIDISKYVAKLRYKLDVRARTIPLNIECDRFCARAVAAGDEDSTPDSSEGRPGTGRSGSER